MKQYILTSSMGKRLIARALTEHPHIERVLASGTLVIIAGSTNGYVAEEILLRSGQADGFTRVGFRRGLNTPPGIAAPEIDFPGDVVIVNGSWQPGKTIFDIESELTEGDVVLKGANVLDTYNQAAVHIGSTQGGTVMAALSAVIGRRVRLIIPVGLEKRVPEDINSIARIVNSPGSEGPRLLPVSGEIFTEIDALEQLTGVDAFLISAGGIYGAEGSIRLGIIGSPQEVERADKLIQSLAGEPPCEV